MHIPVAPACNIKCRYCRRELGGTANRPGVAGTILKPLEALDAVEQVVSEDPAVEVIGVAGPGDALANDSTFEALELIHGRFPWLKKCISTNGLRLPQRVDDLIRVGVTALTVTVNAFDPAVGRSFYEKVRLNGRTYREHAFDVLSERQLEGIELAGRKGLAVKVNTVLVPALNGGHIEDIARTVRELGAVLMNVMPLKPIGDMSEYPAPNCFELEEARFRAEKFIEQFRLCRQCRSDAVGVPGQEGEAGRFSLGESFSAVPLYH